MTSRLNAPARRATPKQLAILAPLGALSAERLEDLSEIATLETAERGSDPLAAHKGAARAVFLLHGEVVLIFEGGGTLVVVGGTGDGRLPLNRRTTPVARARVIIEAELISLDDEMLDLMVTFDQVAEGETAVRVARSIFSLANLRHGVFALLPPARIAELLARFERIEAKRGDVLIREGEEGDFYYVVESGRCRVERAVGGVSVVLAELRSGDAFGEEALASNARRNATVSVASDSSLLRLAKTDFRELLAAPLLQRVSYAEGLQRVAGGAAWLDVRYPSEYRCDRLPGAVNVPLNEVRDSFPVLDRSREYIVYCQSGRRSSAAAFLFAQRGFQVRLLEGGPWAAGRGR